MCKSNLGSWTSRYTPKGNLSFRAMPNLYIKRFLCSTTHNIDFGSRIGLCKPDFAVQLKVISYVFAIPFDDDISNFDSCICGWRKLIDFFNIGTFQVR